MSKKIYIHIWDDTPENVALERVTEVVKCGKISKNNTMYCFLTHYHDDICVQSVEYRKNLVFRVFKHKN